MCVCIYKDYACIMYTCVVYIHVYASLIPRLSSMDVWVLTFENSVMQVGGCTGSKVITHSNYACGGDPGDGAVHVHV